jgi:hypothetical protein
MSFNDMATFMPSKSAYVNPGEYEATQRNVALQKGSYMAQMDAYYRQIDETSRQFDLTHGLETKKFGHQQEIDRGNLGVSRGKLDVDRGMLGVERGKLDWTMEISSAEFLQSLREFEVATALKERELEIGALQGQAYASGVASQNQANKMGTVLDFVGAGALIYDTFSDRP